MKQDLDLLIQLREFIYEINQTNSILSKIDILSNWSLNKNIEKVLYYTYNQSILYYTTSSNCTKQLSQLVHRYTSLFNLLDDLSNRVVTGHEAIGCINGYISIYPEYQDIIFKVIDRNLEIRVDTKTINKVFKDLIPIYSVALAETYTDKLSNKIDFERDEWFASRKLDGVRCQIIIEQDGSIKAYSREGREFKTLNTIKSEFIEFAKKNRGIVFDGEVCIVKENGEDDFQSVMKQINRKDYQIQNAKLYIFDLIDLLDFKRKVSETVLSTRQGILIEIIRLIHSEKLVCLNQVLLKNGSDFKSWIKTSIESNWEGFMIRKNTIYLGKRSFDLIKVKQFNDEEFTVKRLESGDFRVIIEGKEQTIQTLTNVIIDYEGYEVSVGSGFSLKQRELYYKNPWLLIDKK